MPGQKDQDDPSVKRGPMKTESPAQKEALREEREDEEARPLE